MINPIPRAPARPLTWWQALQARPVWWSALRVGLPVGLLQITLNQGDYWLHHHVTTVIFMKTLLTPVISVGVCLASATSAYLSKH